MRRVTSAVLGLMVTVGGWACASHSDGETFQDGEPQAVGQGASESDLDKGGSAQDCRVFYLGLGDSAAAVDQKDWEAMGAQICQADAYHAFVEVQGGPIHTKLTCCRQAPPTLINCDTRYLEVGHCLDPSQLASHAAQDCLASGKFLGPRAPYNVGYCSQHGEYDSIKYSCCDHAPGPSSCIDGSHTTKACLSKDAWEDEVNQICKQQGLVVAATELGIDCSSGTTLGYHSAKYSCCKP